MVQTQLRRASLGDLAELLKQQAVVKHDVVATAQKVSSKDGVIHIEDAGPDGPGSLGRFRPTEVFDDGVSEKLGIPRAYLRRLSSERPDLYDANLNGWLQRDDRAFLARTFASGSDKAGIARAFLSDRFRLGLDNLDAFMAILDGARDANIEVEVTHVDLTERRMQVHFWAPELEVLAPNLGRGYIPPDDHRLARHSLNPGAAVGDIVRAGLVATNSETGGGAFTLAGKIWKLACLNGMIVAKDAIRAVHLGAKMEEGAVKWSEDTQATQVQLIRQMARDAVTTFLNVDYLQSVVDGIEEKAATPLPIKQVEVVTRQLGYDEKTLDTILDHFSHGGQLTAGGLLNAVTSAAQVVADADLAYQMESDGLKALELAAQAS